MMDGSEVMGDIDRDDGELERRLRAYAGARLSPDQWASLRMRAAVIEHGRAARGETPTTRRWRLAWRPVLFVALVGVLAVGTGTTAALAASAGGPLYGTRIWVETTLVSLAGNRPDAQAALVDQRLGEAADAAGAGNDAGANAALSAYDTEVAAAIAASAENRANLEHLRAVIAKRLDHLQGMDKSSPKAAAQIARAIAKAEASLAEIDAQLEALGPDASP